MASATPGVAFAEAAEDKGLSGPSFVERDSASGVITTEVWALTDGRLHREGGPAFIERDPGTGIMTC
jgi:hypothetical protein